MNNINKIIKETLKQNLSNLFKENSNNNMPNLFSKLDNFANNYFSKQHILINNKKEYYNTVKEILMNTHKKIKNLGFNISISKIEKYSDVFCLRYFINESYTWDDDKVESVDDLFYKTFDFEQLDEFGIELSFLDLRDKGNECYFELCFDFDKVETFEY